jgi:hypothetical protein
VLLRCWNVCSQVVLSDFRLIGVAMSKGVMSNHLILHALMLLPQYGTAFNSAVKVRLTFDGTNTD